MHIPLRLAPSLFWSQGRGQRLLVTNTQKPYSPESGPAKGVRPRAKQGQKSRFYNPWYSAPGRNHGGKVTLNNINVEQTVQQVAPLLATEQGLLPALKGGLEVLLLVSLLNPLGLNSSNSSKPPSADPFRKKNAAAGQRPDSARHSVGMCARSRSGRAGMVPATGNRSTPSERVWGTRGILMQESDCALAPPVQIRPQSVPRGDDRRLGRLYRPANPHGELVTRFYHKFLFGKIFAEKNHFFYGWRSWRPRLHQLTKKQIVPIGWSQGPRPSPGSDVQSAAACGTSLWPPGPDQPP